MGGHTPVFLMAYFWLLLCSLLHDLLLSSGIISASAQSQKFNPGHLHVSQASYICTISLTQQDQLLKPKFNKLLWCQQKKGKNLWFYDRTEYFSLIITDEEYLGANIQWKLGTGNLKQLQKINRKKKALCFRTSTNPNAEGATEILDEEGKLKTRHFHKETANNIMVEVRYVIMKRDEEEILFSLFFVEEVNNS